MLSRSLSDCQSLILNAMIQVSFWQTDGFWDQRWLVEHPRFKDEKVTMVVKIIMASWFAQMSDFGLFCWWNDWRPEMHHTSSSLSKTVTHVRWWTPLFSCCRRASCFGPPLFGLYPNGLYPNGLSLNGLQGQLDYPQLDYLWRLDYRRLDYKPLGLPPNWTTYDVWTTAVWTTPQIDYTVIGTTSVWTTKYLIKKFVLKQSK